MTAIAVHKFNNLFQYLLLLGAMALLRAALGWSLWGADGLGWVSLIGMLWVLLAPARDLVLSRCCEVRYVWGEPGRWPRPSAAHGYGRVWTPGVCPSVLTIFAHFSRGML